jgi:hypothetical protein
MLKSLIGNIPNESGLIKKFRFHQGWWRTFVLGEEQGMYWDEKNKKNAWVCNRINNGNKDPHLKNFLSEEIAREAALALVTQEDSGSGIMERDRLYNNLLSSQPLAFNFFASFNANKDLALAFLKTLRTDITSVEKVVFEYAPETKDNSAFDFGFIVGSEAGQGFIGFECKYTDTFSFRRKGSKVNYGEEQDKRYKDYHPIYLANRHRFPDDYQSYVGDKRFNQLFRNELLALQLKGFDFILTGLFCHHQDKDAIVAGKLFQQKIGNRSSDFIVLTYADYFERMQKLNLTWEQRELVMMLWARYSGLSLSKRLLD